MIERKNRTQQYENGQYGLWHGRNKLIVEKKGSNYTKRCCFGVEIGGQLYIEIVWQRVKWVPMG